jgi:nicotinate-nucleotide adenylyltransferase
MADVLSLSQVRFIPTGAPWHRSAPRAPAPMRLEMTRLACAGNPVFCVDEREVASRAPGYTVDTLQALRDELGETQPLCLLLGADAFLGLETWHEWRLLFDLAHVVIAQRPGYPAVESEGHMPDALRGEFARRRTHAAPDLRNGPAGHIFVQEITALDISASRIRSAVARGASPRYLLPDAVLEHIYHHHLYAQ